MKPGLIQVFDGLRLTTEHIDHLQGSFHSAVQDIRQILGLGQVHSGFELKKANGKTVTVMPGLAFDIEKNRIVCDEPTNLQISFENGDTVKYICAKYEQIEGELVEGRPTIIWDGCSILLRGDPPGPKDNEITLGVLKKDEDAESFHIIPWSDYLSQEEVSKEERQETVGEHTEPNGNMAVEPAKEISASSDTAASKKSENTQVIEKKKEANKKTGESAESSLSNGAERRSSDEAPIIAPLYQLCVQQGVTPLNADWAVVSLTQLVDALKEKSRAGKRDPIQFSLAETLVSLDFWPQSISCHSILKIKIELGSKTETAPVGAMAEDAKVNTYNFRAFSQGEFTMKNGTVSQYGASTVQTYLNRNAEPANFSTMEITEQGVAHLKIDAILEQNGDKLPTELMDIYENLELRLMVSPSDITGFTFILKLVWEGGVSEETVKIISNQPPGFSWNGQVAWKAMGEAAVTHKKPTV